MSWNRIYALIYRYALIMRHDMARILDTFYWPFIDLFVWGFLTVYLNKTQLELGLFTSTLISGIILWTLVYSLARDIAVSFLDDMWDRNVINLYCSPLKPSEFLIASFIVSFIRVTVTTLFMIGIAYLFYSYNILIMGIYFLLFFIILVTFSYSLGIFATSLILRFGPGVEIFAWSIPAILTPFSAVFFPLSILPPSIQIIAKIFPTSYIFEGMREILLKGVFNWQNLIIAGFLDIIYLFLAINHFFHVFDKIRRNGTISRFV